MNSQTTSPTTHRPLHPALWAAAIAVILASVAAIAAIFGWIPGSNAQHNEPLAAVAPAATLPDMAAAPAATPTTNVTPPVEATADTTPAAKPATTHKPRTHKIAKQETTPAKSEEAAATKPAERVASVCTTCGTVSAVRTIAHEGEGTGIGAVGGAVVGGVLGNQVGEGNGKRIARIGGAVLGGLAGHQVEKKVRSSTSWEVDVRMEGGGLRTVSYTQQPSWQVGDAVRVDGDSISAR